MTTVNDALPSGSAASYWGGVGFLQGQSCGDPVASMSVTPMTARLRFDFEVPYSEEEECFDSRETVHIRTFNGPLTRGLDRLLPATRYLVLETSWYTNCQGGLGLPAKLVLLAVDQGCLDLEGLVSVNVTTIGGRRPFGDGSDQSETAAAAAAYTPDDLQSSSTQSAQGYHITLYKGRGCLEVHPESEIIQPMVVGNYTEIGECRTMPVGYSRWVREFTSDSQGDKSVLTTVLQQRQQQ